MRMPPCSMIVYNILKQHATKARYSESAEHVSDDLERKPVRAGVDDTSVALWHKLRQSNGSSAELSIYKRVWVRLVPKLDSGTVYLLQESGKVYFFFFPPSPISTSSSWFWMSLMADGPCWMNMVFGPPFEARSFIMSMY